MDDIEQNKDLEKTIHYYADGVANIPSVRHLAKQILDKWSRIYYEINTAYDPDGKYDNGYK